MHRKPAYAELLLKGGHGVALHLRDTEGRPLGERSAPQQLVDQLVIESRPSDYEGRAGLSMNVSGLKQITSHWNDAMSIIDACRRLYCDRFGVETLAINHLWRFSRIATSLASFCHYRKKNGCGDGELAPALAAAYKMVGGPFLTSIKLIGERDGQGRRSFFATCSAQDFRRLSEQRKTFNLRGATCAASPKLVDAFLARIITLPELGERRLSQTEVGSLDDPAGFMSYALLCLLQDYSKILFAAEVGQIYASMMKHCAVDGNESDIEALVQTIGSKAGWLFGVAKSIFPVTIYGATDKLTQDQIEQHLLFLRAMKSDVALELADVRASCEGIVGPTTLDSQWNEEPAAISCIDRAGQTAMQIERQFLFIFHTIQTGIDQVLGWAAPQPLSAKDLRRGAEFAIPSDVFATARR